MIAAREQKGLTQKEVSTWSLVPLHVVCGLERLQFPKTYKIDYVLSIADVLGVEPDDIFPEKLIGWQGQTKISYVKDVKIDRLLEYRDTMEKHYLLPGPDENDEQDYIIKHIKNYMEYLPFRERRILQLRYGLVKDDGGPFTIEEISRIFKVSRERIHAIESKAIRNIQRLMSIADREKLLYG